MLTLNQVLTTIIDPALALLPPNMTSYAAKVQMLAIGQQESRFIYRYQQEPNGVKGPARGFWQFEQGGGVHYVLSKPLTRPCALNICAQRGVQPVESVVWEALETDDILAACFARLFLYLDPQPLPVDDEQAGWDLYQRVWRPGHPIPATWATFYARAQQAAANDVPAPAASDESDAPIGDSFL